MRIGTNPAKAGLPAYAPQPLGVALIIYIPFLEGYFAQSLEIFKYQLASLRAATSQPFDLLVFDNGSCPPVVAELQELHQQGQIDWLVLSRHNVGKAGAWNWIFAALPNELICYADSDVLFRPGWLEASRAVLEAFPQAGMVAAQPNFFDVMKGAGQAHLNLQADPNYTLGDYQPAKDIVDEYCLGIGANEELAAQFHQEALPAITNREGNIQAVLGASHMQFVIPRAVARQVVPLPATKGLLRAETMSLDYKVDELGYLHLSTLEPYVFHMGNTVTEYLRQELEQLSLSTATSVSPGTPAPRRARRLERWLTALAKRPRLHHWFLRAYNFLFRLLYGET